MAPQKTLHNNRYPGIRSFEARDKNLFYGRNKEIEELFHFIKVKQLVVLFGKSGLGKTSLLKAGVGPLLIKQKFFPLVIRLQDVEIPPTATVLTALEPYIDTAALEKFGGKSANKIWEALQASNFETPDGAKATPVLVFDQFEELFNHPTEVQQQWTSFIGDIIEERLPKDVEDAIYKIPRSQRTEAQMEWYKPRPVKVIFAIRSDRMSELHQLRFEIPAILQNRYELKPLNIAQAKDAIEKPAALTGSEYSTAPFSFAPETITKIQKELSNDLHEIESFQLQIVCQHVEQKVKEQQAETKKSIVVTPDYLGDEKGIKTILKNYYKTQLQLLGTEKEQLAARKLLEEGLIMNKRRIGVAEAVVQETYNVDDDLLTKLLNSRLIRPEDTRLGRTYEISHDTLVKPILEAYEKRRIQEERLAAREEHRQLEKEKQRRLKVRNLTLAGFILGGLVILSTYQTFKANTAVDELKVARDSLVEKQQVLAEEYLLNQEIRDSLFEENEKLFSSVSVIANLTDFSRRQVLRKIDSLAEMKIKQQQAIEQSMAEQRALIETYTKALFSASESVRSKNAFQLTKQFKTNTELPAILIDNTLGKITKENINTVYQVIYVLEKTDSESLQNNSAKVNTFLKDVRASGLIGPSTEMRLKRIERKL